MAYPFFIIKYSNPNNINTVLITDSANATLDRVLVLLLGFIVLLSHSLLNK